MTRDKKGVSPIIAVVILIAVAVSIGIMVTTWVTHWVTTQTGKDDITCSVDTNYVIDSAKFNDSGNNNLLIKVTNKGTKEIYGFGLVLDNGTMVTQYNSSASEISLQPNILSTSKLTQEHSVYITLNLTNSSTTDAWLPILGSTLTEVRVTNDACVSIAQTTKSITQP